MFPPWSCVGFTLFTGPGVLSVAFVTIADHWLEVRLISLKKKKVNLNLVRDSSFSVHSLSRLAVCRVGFQSGLFIAFCVN